MSKIKAVLFDLDGVIRDSKEVVYGAAEHTLTVLTGASPDRTKLSLHIHHHEEIHKVFAGHIDKKTFIDIYYTRVDELRPQMVPFSGVHEIVRSHKPSYSIGLVTAARAWQYLELHNIQGLFDVVVCDRDNLKRKPHSEPVEVAISRLGIMPKQAVMVGDLPTDIQAAKAAGLKTAIGVSYGMGSREALEAVGADYILESLEELPVLLERLEKENGSQSS